MLVLATVARIARFERWVSPKSIDQFSELEGHLPRGQMIAISVADPPAFEWASYYLRDHKTIIRSGSLVYNLSPDPTREPYATRLNVASLLVTDAGSSFGSTPIWSNSHYSVYSVGRAEEADATPR